jgi:tRNA pseudouridine38-40 synthase
MDLVMAHSYYKIIVSYDGTDYAGWQYQPDEVSITNVLQDTFVDVFGKQIKITGASRTDAGVHALGQVASFQTDLRITSEQLLHAWNNRLPQDVVVKSATRMPDVFRPMAHVLQKTYWYHVFPERPSPFVARYGYHLRYPFDPKKLQEGLQIFVGKHDFRAFTSDDVRENTVRTIDAIKVQYLKQFNMYRVEFKATGFLRYMIRRIVGAALEVASRPSLNIDLLNEILAARNPEHTLPNAPAKGLLLYKITYGDLDE